MSKIISQNLLRHLELRELQEAPPSITRLESEVFGGVSSNESFQFWTDAMQATYETADSTEEWNYRTLLFCLFIAMTDKEIADIRDSYFDSSEHRRMMNRNAV